MYTLSAILDFGMPPPWPRHCPPSGQCGFVIAMGDTFMWDAKNLGVGTVDTVEDLFTNNCELFDTKS